MKSTTRQSSVNANELIIRMFVAIFLILSAASSGCASTTDSKRVYGNSDNNSATTEKQAEFWTGKTAETWKRGAPQPLAWDSQVSLVKLIINGESVFPVSESRRIDIFNGELPAPNLLPGCLTGINFRESKMGLDYEKDPITGVEIIPSFPQSLFSGTQANPILRTLNYIVPGVLSATSYHDLSMRPVNGVEKDKLEKARTILPRFMRNYYAAVGTLIDVVNWQWPKNRNQGNNNQLAISYYSKSSYGKNLRLDI